MGQILKRTDFENWEKKISNKSRNYLKRTFVQEWGFALCQYNGLLKNLEDNRATAREGMALRAVNPAYTSQRCCGCGHIGKENRNDKTNTKHFECVQCGHKEDADVNAARNIRFLGIEELRKQTQKMASGERLDRSRWRLEGFKTVSRSE